MSNSYPLVSFGLDDTNIKNKISSVTDIYGYLTFHQSFCNLNDLQTGNKTIVPYATFEPDYWLLDGSHHFMPSTPVIGTMANALSNSSRMVPGFFLISIFFTTIQSIRYLTLFFDVDNNEWCDSVQIDFWTAGAVNLFSTTLTPSSPTYTLDCGSTITGIDHINIQLNRTSKAYRFARLTGIDFNAVTHLDGAKIKSAKILEEISPISSTISSNTFDLDLILNTNEFSITNPSSPYTNIPEKMPFMVYEVVDNVTQFMGQFYLDKWENNVSERVASFHCIDAIGLLAGIPFYGWNLYITSIVTKLTHLMTLSGLSMYGVSLDIDPVVSSYTGTGDIEPGSLRDALQQIAFACQLTVDCSRDYKIKIYPTIVANDMVTVGVPHITNSQQAIQQVTHLPSTDWVKIARRVYTAVGATPVAIYSAYLAAGTYVIPFNSPISYAYSGLIFVAEYINSSAIYWNVVIVVSSPGTITINSYGAAVLTAQPPQIYPPSYPFNAPTTNNVVEINPTLTSDLGASNNDFLQAFWVYRYYYSRYYQKSKTFGSATPVGTAIQIDSLDGATIYGVIERNNIDLMGFVTTLEVTGWLA